MDVKTAENGGLQGGFRECGTGDSFHLPESQRRLVTYNHLFYKLPPSSPRCTRSRAVAWVSRPCLLGDTCRAEDQGPCSLRLGPVETHTGRAHAQPRNQPIPPQALTYFYQTFSENEQFFGGGEF